MARARAKRQADLFPKAESMIGFVGNAHHGASTTNRDVSEWYTARGSADGDLLPDLPELQYRARDIRRNNGFAQSIVSTLVENIVGQGIRFCSEPDYLRLQAIDPKFDKAWAEDFAARYEAIFHEWWWSTACHAGDTKTGDMLTEEVLYAKFDNGGSLTLPLWLPDRGDGFSTKLQTVEIDRLSNPNGAPNTDILRGGVKFDSYGMPVGYWIKTTHPGDGLFMGQNFGKWEFIARRTSFGRLRVIHDYDGDRADQTRGKPLLAAVLDQFKNIDRYVKAEIQAAISNACIWGAITTPLGHDDIVEMFKNNEQGYLESRKKHAAPVMRANTLATLYPGDQLESFMPQRPAAGFGVFVENIEKIITVATGIPHILSKKDFAKSNYSNTRAAMADAYRGYSRRRDRLGAGWLDPINALLMEEVVNDGRIDAPRFYEFKRAYLRGTWIGPAMGYIDKAKEVTGDILSVNANQDTLRRVAALRGMHWKELIDQRASEIAYLEKQGLSAVSTTEVGDGIPTDPVNPDDEEPPSDDGALPA